MPKKCAICHVVKPDDAFNRSAKASDRLYSYCRECSRVKVRAAYVARGKKSWMNDKVCSHCNTLKPRSDYRRTADGKVPPRCAACEDEVAAKESVGLRRCNICRQWHPGDSYYPSHWKKKYVTCRACITQANRTKYRERHRNYLLKKQFGITLDQYKELLAKQGHKCPVCLVAFEPDNYSYHVDHAHSGPFKGRIRAIVHSECNRTVIWMHEDGDALRRAADLIENPLTDWVVPGNHPSEVRREKIRNAKK